MMTAAFAESHTLMERFFVNFPAANIDITIFALKDGLPPRRHIAHTVNMIILIMWPPSLPRLTPQIR